MASSSGSQRHPKRTRETIQEMKARMRRLKEEAPAAAAEAVADPFAPLEAAFAAARLATVLLYDDAMALHQCPWDDEYPESPARYIAIMDRFYALDLYNRCVITYPGVAHEDDVERVHLPGTFDKLRRICELGEAEREAEASRYDAIYFNKETFQAARVAAGAVLTAVRAVCAARGRNAFALVRPPGHHATRDAFGGYCYFNNVAVGALAALAEGLARRVLVVDFDVHHGQATQRAFYDDPRVLYFSLHRYELGAFWPNLRESDFDHHGRREGRGFNVNVPLNATGLEDKDYFAVVFNILLPIAYEFDPDLLIYSAGYDACVGCPEGEMKLSPGFYGQLVTLLGGLANGRQVVCLEGGYFVDSLAEGAAQTLKALLHDAPQAIKPFGAARPEVSEVINNLRFMLQPFWKSLADVNLPGATGEDVHRVVVKYVGSPPKAPFLTRNCYPTQSEEQIQEFKLIVENYREEYSQPVGDGVCYAFDIVMLEHKPPASIPENPQRLKRAHEKFVELKLDERCIKVPTRKATRDELLLVHDGAYVESLLAGRLSKKTQDIYFGKDSLNAILTSAGSVLSIVDGVMTNQYRSGIALIRPPGHHAESGHAMGFCFVNNIAIAAKYMLKKFKLKRVLIVDFDVHHGNGTQQMFYSSKEVLYISIHQFNDGSYFPNSIDGDHNNVGSLSGVGFNVNIPLNKRSSAVTMGDSEYMAIFHRIVLPIAFSFAPEVVLVSAGFDAGIDDPLGNFKVTPAAFGHFVQLLKPLARGKLILALEGGYNANTVAYSTAMCVKALLGDPLPGLEIKEINQSALMTIHSVINSQKPHWPILWVNKVLPERIEKVIIAKDSTNPIVVVNPERDESQDVTEEYRKGFQLKP